MIVKSNLIAYFLLISLFVPTFFVPTFAAQVHSQGLRPVPAKSFAILGPENSRIEFVGTHVGDEPKPRLGGFKEFRGMAGVDVATGKIESLELSFEIGSIWTEFDNLTAHLMRADFFDQVSFPQASFRSTQIAMLGNGRCNIKGELRLHGQASEITFPANYQLSENGLTLTSQFMLDRTKFGMDQMTDGVEKEVSINFSVGVPDRNTLADKSAELQPQPVPLKKCFVINAENSSVEFVGTHVGDDPKPRLGGFGNFRGLVFLNETESEVQAISLDFEVGSIWTEFDKLTSHLMTPDFFDRDQFPVAKFRSSKITATGNGDHSIKGSLEMLGTTGEVTFAATVKLDDNGMMLTSEFLLDRTAFGMKKMTDGVEPNVTIQFDIGKPDRNAQPKTDKADGQSMKRLKTQSQIVKVFLPNMLQY